MSSDSYYAMRKRKWDTLAETWQDTGPPASPSIEDIGNYRKLLQEQLASVRDGRIIILGSTPRLRDMLAEDDHFRQFEVVCVDFSTLMYERASHITKTRNSKERLELADWLTFDVGSKMYDAVLGDKVIDNIMPTDWHTFFLRIHSHLRPGGGFIAHLALADEQFRNVTFTSALTKWSGIYDAGISPLEDVVSGLWEDVLTASAFKDGNYFNTVKTGRFSDEVEQLQLRREHLANSQARVFDEFIRVFWPTHDDEWSSYKYEEIIERMKGYFEHDCTVFSSDYNVATVQPIVRMKAI